MVLTGLGLCAPGTQQTDFRDAVERRTVRRTLPTVENSPAECASHAEVENAD